MNKWFKNLFKRTEIFTQGLEYSFWKSLNPLQCVTTLICTCKLACVTLTWQAYRVIDRKLIGIDADRLTIAIRSLKWLLSKQALILFIAKLFFPGITQLLEDFFSAVCIIQLPRYCLNDLSFRCRSLNNCTVDNQTVI